MEGSPWLDPRFLFAVAVAVIGGIAWLIRLESKVNSIDKTITRLDLSLEEGWKDFDQHRTNDGVHFNQRLASEVAERQNDRMARMEKDVTEIKAIVKEIASK